MSDSEEAATSAPENALERHAQTILVIVVAALITWVGLSITGLRETAIELKGEIKLVTSHFDALQKQLAIATTDRIRKSEAEAAFELRDERIHTLNRRMSSLEEWAKEALKHRDQDG